MEWSWREKKLNAEGAEKLNAEVAGEESSW
jgi:hypothetical protein